MTDSPAENAVYEALKAYLPAGWYAWHSLRIMEPDGVFGEGDFVIAHPTRGLLILEVKGGVVEVRDGLWLQNGKPMKRGPREQAYEFQKKLLSRLRRERCAPPAYGIATCFPDTGFEAAPSQDDLALTTIGQQDLPWLGERLPIVLAHALPAAAGRPRGRWLERLHDLWGQTWLPELKLGSRARLEEARRVKLDHAQLSLLEAVKGNSRVLVEGAAGTGKTLMARAAALRFAEGGKRVLLLCFTNALADWMRRTIGDPNVRVWALGSFLLDCAQRVGLDAREPADNNGWDRLTLAVATATLPPIATDWDALVIDEGQDFSNVDWDFVFELARDRRCWIFADRKQHFWPERQLPPALARFTQVVLPESHRCPPAILALADAYLESPAEATTELIRHGLEDGTIAIVACPSETSMPDHIAAEINRLRAEGFRPADIAIVSVRGQQRSKTFGLERIGAHRVVKADDPAAETEIVDDTFLRFKGLERDAVIVTDLALIHDRRAVRMYIAVTRALATVRIVAPRATLLEDPVLAGLL